MCQTRIHVDQRTLAFYGVSHAEFERRLCDELAFTESMGCEIDVVPDARDTDHIQFPEACTMISALGIAPEDLEELKRGVHRAWKGIPKTFSQGGARYRILPAADGGCVIIDETRPEAPIFAGAWYHVVRFLRLTFARSGHQDDSR